MIYTIRVFNQSEDRAHVVSGTSSADVLARAKAIESDREYFEVEEWYSEDSLKACVAVRSLSEINWF